jgi:pimeloyl-ACP methyl ester carboxylesterase
LARHVAVVFVHGILANEFDFAARMENKLRQRLPADFQDFVHFRSAFWAGTVREHQRDYFGRARTTGATRHNRLRRYVIEGLGDAAAYQKTRHRQNSVYYDVQAQISAKIKSLDLPGRENCPLIFVGHSLGCHVISSFLWDLNKLTQRTEEDIKADDDADVRALWYELKDATPFRRLKTCAGIVTLGSNMPMFTFTFGPDSVYPITARVKDSSGRMIEPAFPGVALPEPLRKKARWLNFYSSRDLLGFPLKALNDDYRNAEKIHDIRVCSQSPWLVPYLWCVFAHTRYWTNRIVLRDTSQLIRDMIETPLVEPSEAASH